MTEAIKVEHLPLMGSNTLYDMNLNNFTDRNQVIPPDTTLEKVIGLLTDPHSKKLKERHQKAVKKICKKYGNGFYLKDVNLVSEILQQLSKRSSVDKDYVAFLVQVIMLCGKSFLKEKSSDDVTFEGDYLLFLNKMVQMVTIPNVMVQIAVTHAIGNLYCTPVPVYTSGPQSCLHEYNIKAIEDSNIVHYFAEELKKMEDNAVYQEILHLLLFLSLSSCNCDSILEIDVIDVIAKNMYASSHLADKKLLQLSVEVLWNIAEYGDPKTVQKKFTSEACIRSLSDTFCYFIKNAKTNHEIQLRNDIMSVAHVIVTVAPKAPIIECGLVKAVSLVATKAELDHMDELVSTFVMKPSAEDFELKKLLWTSLIQMCDNDAMREIMMECGFMEALFSYIKPNDSICSVQWTSAQYEELQLQALSSLEALAPYCLGEYMKNHGNTRLLLLLEWAYNDSEFSGHGNSFYSDGGYRNKIAQLRYTVRVILAVVRCQNESVTEDLCDQALIDSLIQVLSLYKGKEIMFELGVLSNILLILSILCEHDSHRKEMFGNEGISILLEFLSAEQSRCMSHLGYQKLLLSAVNAIWCCVSNINHDYFLEQGGIPILLDLLEKCPPSMQNLVLGAVLDLSEDPKSVPHIVTWRGHGQKSIVSLLIELWVKEEESLGVKRGKRNLIIDIENPLTSFEQYSMESPSNALSTSPSPAILDVSDNMRCKIFALIHRIGFDKLPPLTAEEQVTLTVIESYLDFKAGEIWQEIAREIEVDNIVPIQSDQNGLAEIKEIILAKNEAVRRHQHEILESRACELYEMEQLCYQEIKSNFKQWELQESKRLDFMNRTSDFEALQLSKEKKTLLAEKSRPEIPISPGVEHETLLKMLTTTVHSGRHINVPLSDNPSVTSPHPILPAIPRSESSKSASVLFE